MFILTCHPMYIHGSAFSFVQEPAAGGRPARACVGFRVESPNPFFSAFPTGTVLGSNPGLHSLKLSFGPAVNFKQRSGSSQSKAASQCRRWHWRPQPTPVQPRHRLPLTLGPMLTSATPLPCGGCTWQFTPELPVSSNHENERAAGAVSTTGHPASG